MLKIGQEIKNNTSIETRSDGGKQNDSSHNFRKLSLKNPTILYTIFKQPKHAKNKKIIQASKRSGRWSWESTEFSQTIRIQSLMENQSTTC
jgi:hypothetical protein